ncbi:H-NS family nucleoid-associated regulatory protein [Actibacterium sp. 188UL27-1]|uniref:H-NS histone family protein n=1 Tax=Actibacterium sp. 188UL27-1 TaxID=2786961 RepID=UPI001957361D|nr:H-NS histone family protein [Actibacterium sp. 188UL27-1]MBM7066527.1 H-NS histone family protein [Actibacterium sp. 188UL27-1]
MAIDLHALSRKELEKLQVDIDKALAKVAEEERKAALAAAEKAVANHGFSLDELIASGAVGGKKGRNAPKSPAKYRNPDNPEQTWSGRGRRPGWIAEAEADGKVLADLEI